MDNDSTTFGLEPDKLAELWQVGNDIDMDSREENQDQQKAELLRDRLARKIPMDQVVAGILPKALSQVCEEIQPFSGNSYGHLLYDPETDVAILQSIKDHSKKQAKQIDTESEREVMAAVYYAAIANALVYHKQLITSFSYDQLSAKFTALLENTWLTEDIRTLFQGAKEYCATKDTNEKSDTS